MSRKRVSYFYWKCHWDLEKVMGALALHYGVPYREGDSEMMEPVVTAVYMHYHKLQRLNVDVHESRISGDLKDLRMRGVVPECIMGDVYFHACKQKTDGFDLGELMAFPPYDCDWEKSRPVTEGILEEQAYAA